MSEAPKDTPKDPIEDKKFVSTNHVESLFKTRYEAEHRRKENLDKKSNNLLVGSTTVISILGGFGLLSETNFFAEDITLTGSLIVLIVSLSVLIISIIVSVIALSLRDYWTIMDLDQFGSLSNNKVTPKVDEIDKLRTTNPDLLSAMTINGYVEFGLKNKQINDDKAKWIIGSQILFIIGIGSIPLFIYLS